ncbi:unnamed protein product, partial [Phaeothamnion confervicola]
VTPCLLPEWGTMVRLHVSGERYFPVSLELATDPALLAAVRDLRRVFVKRKAGHLSYRKDPLALRSLLHRS